MTTSRLPKTVDNGPPATARQAPKQIAFAVAPDPDGNVIVLRLPHDMDEHFKDNEPFRLKRISEVEFELIAEA